MKEWIEFLRYIQRIGLYGSMHPTASDAEAQLQAKGGMREEQCHDTSAKVGVLHGKGGADGQIISQTCYTSSETPHLSNRLKA